MSVIKKSNDFRDSIRALQVEDIVSQLSQHIQQRLEHINEVAVFSHTEIANAADEKELQVAAKKLQLLRGNFHSQNIVQRVAQESMSEGALSYFSHLYRNNSYVYIE